MKKRRFVLKVPFLGEWFFYADDWAHVGEIVDGMIEEVEEERKQTREEYLDEEADALHKESV